MILKGFQGLCFITLLLVTKCSSKHNIYEQVSALPRI